MVSATKWLGGIILALISAGLKAAAVDPRIGQGVALTTTSTGFGVMFDWLPTHAGTMAALAGFVLSVVLIVLHLIKGRLETMKLKLEIAIIREKEAERIANAEARALDPITEEVQK